MHKTYRIFHSTLVILIVAILLAGCSNGGVSSSVSVSYSPPLLPIEITYDLSTGQIKLALNGRIQTPIGTFKASYAATSIGRRYDGVRTLTVITGTNKYVYKLEPGRPYSIRLPSDENGQAEVRYSGTDENVEIVIPNPTNETVAELRQKLQEEQEARQRAEAGSAAPSPESQTEGILQPVPYQSPTPPQQPVLTSQECQELVARYTPGTFLYIPPECEDMFRAYQSYLQQQEYEAKQRQQREEYEARQKQQQEDRERDRREEEQRRKDDEAARRRQQRIEQWSNIIEGILRRRRR